jgi:DNA-binding transcriptional ArsR family regulator
MQRTLPSVSDVRVLEALADQDRLLIVLLLYEGPATQKELAAALDLNSGVLSRHMAKLEDADLVKRRRSHGPYALLAPRDTWQFVRVTATLTGTLTEARKKEHEEWEREVQRAAMRPAGRDVQTETG